jgi:hypothetical protein
MLKSQTHIQSSRFTIAASEVVQAAAQALAAASLEDSS